MRHRPASLKGKVLCLNTGMHRLFDDSKAYYHYSIGTGIDAGKWFVKHGVKCVAWTARPWITPCTPPWATTA